MRGRGVAMTPDWLADYEQLLGGAGGGEGGGDSLLVLGRFHELLSLDASKINGKIKCDSAPSSSWCRQTKIDYLQTLYLHCA